MPIGDKVYFSGLDGSDSLKVSGTNTLLHNFSDNNAQETWLYASAPSATTVTLTSPSGSTLDLNVSANSETALLSGQLLSYGNVDFDPNVNNDVQSLALQSDGKIVIGGTFTSVGGVTRWGLARVHANGDLDTTFDPNVARTGEEGADPGQVASLAIQSDGKIVIGGDSFFNLVGGVTRNKVARVHANGDLDTTFDPNANNVVRSVALQSDGKIVIGGSFTSVGGVTRNRIARLHTNGALDTTFDPNAGNQLYAVAVQSDGKIVICGEFTSVGGVTRNRVARVHANGALDTTFNPNANDLVRSIAEQSDGKIVIGGAFTSVGGVTRRRVARFHANGDLDTTFADPGAASQYSSVYSLTIQSDDKIVIGGFFTNIGGGTRYSIARLHANGALDTTFNPNANTTVQSLALQSDGKIVIGGQFTSVGGVTRNRVALLDQSGALGTVVARDLYVNSTSEVWVRGYVKSHTT